MASGADFAADATRELDITISRIQTFLEQHGYESSILRQNRERAERIAAREAELLQWEESLKHREDVLAQAMGNFKAKKYMCQYCGLDVCGRRGPCFDGNGSLHRHHNCDACHRLWKQGKPKGSGRGGTTPRAPVNMDSMD